MKDNRLTKQAELELLESFRLLSENASKIPNFTEKMEPLGYNAEKMQEGKNIYSKALEIYNQNQEETAKQKRTYTLFAEALEALKENYQKHRKVTKVALMKNREFWKDFELDKQLPQAYLKQMQTFKNFYNQVKKLTAAKTYLEPFGINDTIAQEALTNLQKVETLRAEYEKVRSESQNFTKKKNQALTKLQVWLREYYSVAHIVLEDDKQRLESIGKFIRS